MQNPKVINLTMTTADVEYSQVIPNCAGFTLQCRSANDVLVAFNSGESGATYFTVKNDDPPYKVENIKNGYNANGDVVIYAQCAAAGKILEIICWTR